MTKLQAFFLILFTAITALSTTLRMIISYKELKVQENQYEKHKEQS